MSLRVNYAIGGGKVETPYRRRVARVQLGIFERPEADLRLDHRALGHLLVALVGIDCDYLIAHPEVPELYDPRLGVRYTMAYERAGEEFADVPTVLRRRAGDCDDLACFRVAELRVRHRILARPYFVHRYEPGSRRPVYHVMVELPDGTIEDPSRRLGMGGTRVRDARGVNVKVAMKRKAA